MIDDKALLSGFGEFFSKNASTIAPTVNRSFKPTPQGYQEIKQPGIIETLDNKILRPVLNRFGEHYTEGMINKAKSLPWGAMGIGAAAIGIPMLMMGMGRKQPQQQPININIGGGPGMVQGRGQFAFAKPGITG